MLHLLSHSFANVLEMNTLRNETLFLSFMMSFYAHFYLSKHQTSLNNVTLCTSPFVRHESLITSPHNWYTLYNTTFCFILFIKHHLNYSTFKKFNYLTFWFPFTHIYPLHSRRVCTHVDWMSPYKCMFYTIIYFFMFLYFDASQSTWIWQCTWSGYALYTLYHSYASLATLSILVRLK